MIKQPLTIGICLALHVSAGAATEYLLFEGSIISNYYLGFNVSGRSNFNHTHQSVAFA